MTTPINPSAGAPIQRPNPDKPKVNAPSGDKFTLPGAGPSDQVSTRGLSLGSLGPLVKTDLTAESAVNTANQLQGLLSQESLSVVNTKPETVTALFDNKGGQDKGDAKSDKKD